VPSGIQEQDLLATLEADGRTLVAYQAKPVPDVPMPPPVVPPPPPKRVKTNEELYQAGIRLQQFYSPAAEPDPYFEEAIRRDPGDFRANTALGILYYRRGMFTQAEERLSAAVGRASFNYTNPKDGEAFYYLGLAEKALGKNEPAWESFYKATWSWAWHAPAYYGLAELSCRKGDFARALAFLDESLAANAANGKALNLKSALLRKSGRENEAAAVASAALALDPLDQRSRRELRLAKGQGPAPVLITGGTNDDVQPYLEMAVDYSNAGLWDEGITALNDLVNGYADKQRVHAMAYYWLGWLSEQRGNTAEAARWRQLASRMPTDYVFPFRVESIEALRHAMAANPSDARAPYYLGSLLYDLQPAEALHVWERAAALDGNFALLQRNLALAYARVAQDNQKAKASIERAVTLKPEPRFLVEMDEISEAAGVPVAERYAALEKYGDRVRERDDAMGRLIGLNVQLGYYDKALELLSSRHFNVWEGGENALHDSWVNAHLLRGDAHFHAGQFPQALKDYQAALDYPENLAVGRPLDGGRSPVAYLAIAETQKQLGNQAPAKSALKQSVAETGARTRNSAWSDESAEIAWYKARAFEMLGNRTEAAQVYDMLVRSGQSLLSESAEVDYFAKFAGPTGGARHLAHAHYVLALGYLGQGKTAEAKSEFEAALRYDNNHAGAKRQLGWMDNPVQTARRQ
jgi:tetratricopeptide (TPR) repeat protein